MVHFQSKAHLLMWLEANCPRRAIVRALRDGTVEHLGGFSTIPPTSHPGWIVRVTSVYGREWFVAVIAYQNRYGIRILGKVPWVFYCGDSGTSTLMVGDKPYKPEFIDEVTE